MATDFRKNGAAEAVPLDVRLEYFEGARVAVSHSCVRPVLVPGSAISYTPTYNCHKDEKCKERDDPRFTFRRSQCDFYI
jgi:hypothetical protein